MARTLKSDRWLFLITLLLVGTSILMVYSASAVKALDEHHSRYYFLFKQLSWAVLGFGVLFVGMRVDYRLYRKPAVIWSLLVMTVTLLVAVFFSPTINNTKRWLSLGFGTFQPAELAKIVVVLFTAAVLERRMHRINEVLYSLLPIAFVTFALVGLIVAQPDFGTSAVIVGIMCSMVFVAGIKYRYLILSMAILGPAAAAVILAADYRTMRVISFLDPWADPDRSGYQVIQSMLAIGSGGLFGRGLMEGVQKLYYLPEAHTDFIYAVIGEEFGLIGTMAVLACFVLIAWRGMRVALFAPDRFGSLLAIGITMAITLQAFFNMSVVMSLLPTKGIPLPFVSNGGSSLLISMACMSVLLNISQQASAAGQTALSTSGQGWQLERQEA